MAGLGLSLLAAPAFGQVLDEIIVTATKREEIVRDIPMSISVTGGEEIVRERIRGLVDLSQQTSNLVISNGLTTDNIYIRGIGSGNERSFEQAVGMFIDSIYMPRSRQYRAPFFDIDRVEVARGPQSVLFGLNATAGAIAIHTARTRPGEALTADITAEYEFEYGGTALTTVFGGSPNEKTGLRFAARVFDSGDGSWQNLATGEDENTLEDMLLRGSIVIEPTDALTIDAKVEYSEFERNGNIDELFTNGAAYSDGDDRLNWVRGQDAGLLPLFPTPREPGFGGELLNVAASIDARLGAGGTVTGMLGYSDYDWDLHMDLDSGPAPIIDAGILEQYEQTSAEIRYTSNGESRFQYILGAYYATNEMWQEQPNLIDGNILLGPAGFPVAGFDAGRLWSNAQFEQEEDVFSVYGLLNWAVNEKVEIRAGLRYVESEKHHERFGDCLVRRSDGTFDDLDAAANPNDALFTLLEFCPTPLTPALQSRTSDNVLPELSVQWNVSDSTMIYAKSARSAKSGGFVASTVVIPMFFEYDDETGAGLELGLKTSLSDGRAEISVAAFHTDYENLQLNSLDPNTGASIVTNAAEVRSKGIEVEGRWAASDHVTVGASVGYLDATFRKFDLGPCYSGEPVNPDGFSCDKTGGTPPFSPDYSGTAYVDIVAPLGDTLEFLGGLTVNFSDDYFTNAPLDPLGRQDGYTKMNARIGIGDTNGRWRLSLIGRNLTEEVVNNYTEAFLGVYRGYLQEPRTIWLQGRFSLGD